MRENSVASVAAVPVMPDSFLKLRNRLCRTSWHSISTEEEEEADHCMYQYASAALVWVLPCLQQLGLDSADAKLQGLDRQERDLHISDLPPVHFMLTLLTSHQVLSAMPFAQDY